MMTIRQLLDEKGHDVFSVAPNDTVYAALGKMAEKDVGSLVVMDGERLVGLITERDYARKVFLKGRASPTTRVQDIMETKVLYAQPDRSVEECMAIMTDKRVRHLPVIDGVKLIGVISIGDLVKSIIIDQKFLIDQLEHFITGQRC
jgi:CBS domain-containing protein